MRSGFEYLVRDALERFGADFEYESEEISYTSPVRGGHCTACGSPKVGKARTYTPDFVVRRTDGTKVYIEAKGRLPSTDRSKMRDVMKSNPTLDVRFLFQRRSKAEEAKLREWANKFGFYCAFGPQPPEEWIR